MDFIEYKSDGKPGKLTSDGNFLIFDYDSKSKTRKIRKSTIEEVETISKNPIRYVFYVLLSFVSASFVNLVLEIPDSISIAAIILLGIIGLYSLSLVYYHSKYSHVVKLKTVSGSTIKLLTNGPDDQLFK